MAGAFPLAEDVARLAVIHLSARKVPPVHISRCQVTYARLSAAETIVTGTSRGSVVR